MWYDNQKYLKFIMNNNEDINSNSKVKVASFDLDDTLIHVNKKDYTFNYIVPNTIIEKVVNLISDGYLFVIFTNQSGISNGKNFNLSKWKLIIEKIFHDIKNKCSCEPKFMGIYVSINYDEFRKPNPILWEHFLNDIGSTKVDTNSFYCGDAAGRQMLSTFKQNIYKKPKTGDFSNSDLLFAYNIKVSFRTPENVFLNEENYITIQNKINPSKELKIKYKIPEFIKSESKEIILMSGYPASGKSFYATNYIVNKYSEYQYLSQDICKTNNVLQKQLQKCINKNESVIIDNTNLSNKERLFYINIANINNYEIRLIKMDVSFDLAKHLNNTRMLYNYKKNEPIKYINDIAFNFIKNKYEEVKDNEIYTDIIIIKSLISILKDNKLWKKTFEILT